MQQPIFHIARRNEWTASGADYVPQDFERDGFIHCATASQVLAVANSRFRGQPDLIVLVVDPARVGAEIRYENLSGGTETFPHIYGSLERAAVLASEELRPEPNGSFAAGTVLARYVSRE